jgi:hypothetical protein
MNDQVTTKAHGTSEPYPDASGTGMCESSAPSGSLRCDGVVGLRSPSAEAEDIEIGSTTSGKVIITMLGGERIRIDTEWAIRLRARLDEAIRQAEATTVRQPEPNNKLSHEAAK